MDSVRDGLARRGGASHADSPPPHDRRRGVRHESAIDGALARPLRRPGSVAFQAAMTPFVGGILFSVTSTHRPPALAKGVPPSASGCRVSQRPEFPAAVGWIAPP